MANKLNLDRSQRLDITCKRNDTFKMNLELKDDDGVAIDLNATAVAVSSTNPLYSFKMQVRYMDTHDESPEYDATNQPEGWLISIFATIVNSSGADTRSGTSGTNGPDTNTNLAEFKIDHDAMTLASGVYVYDIQRYLIHTEPTYADGVARSTTIDGLGVNDIDEVETILYGVFTVNEDVTLL